MALFQIEHYLPLLHSRAAEVRAYAELPASTRDVSLPVFVVHPWPNANNFDSMWSRVQDAVAGRRFGVDLDRTRRAKSSGKPAQPEFDRLFETQNGFENFYNAVEEQDGAVPVIRQEGFVFEQIDVQLEHVARIGRGAFARLKRQEPADWASILQRLPSPQMADVALILDMGWGSDVLQHASWARAMINQIIEVDPEREIVVCASSFPASFQMVTDQKDIPIEERILFSQIRRELNANLIYGDWGSTRAPEIDSAPMRNIARVDVPLAQVWRSFRSEKFDANDPQSEREGYQHVCLRAVSDSAWQGVPNVWGKYLIEAAAQGLPSGLKSAARAASARINLHIQMQAHGDTPELIQQTDEPYID